MSEHATHNAAEVDAHAPATETPEPDAAHAAPAKHGAKHEKHGEKNHHDATEAGGHGADGHSGGHGGAHGGRHKSHDHDLPPGTPPWLISFGDMMTLFLCFFIMLVTMAKTQDAGLMAKGLGPFMASLELGGSDGPMDGGRMLDGINKYRLRFGLEPLTEEELASGYESPKDPAGIEDMVRQSLRSAWTLEQPLIATFAEDSAELSDDSKHYLDLMASSLRPGQGQVLVLEGHADDAGARFDYDDTLLALRRAVAVAKYFVEELGFITVRVEPRAWPREPERNGTNMRRVDARVVQPIEPEQN
ncbi:MAG: OmpA family protein [Planctomycetes bacterium]|nr:OmpA family protein [Planctomycetota bacterium]